MSDNIPHYDGNSRNAMDLQKLRLAIKTLFAKCRMYKTSLRNDAALAEYWPLINRYTSDLLRISRDIEHYDELVDTLSARYHDLDERDLRERVGDVVVAAESIADIIDIRQLSEYPPPPEDEQERKALEARVDNFCDAFTRAHNKLGDLSVQTAVTDSEGFVDWWIERKTVIETVRTTLL